MTTSAAADAAPLRICCVTWNVAAHAATLVDKSAALSAMLLDRQGGDDGQQLPDMYAISLQEIVELNAVNILFSGSETEEAIHAWSQVLLRTLNNNSSDGAAASGSTSFSLLAAHAVVGTGVVLIAQTRHLQSGLIPTSSVLTESVNLGAMYTGNKAAVAARARLGAFTACFISVHLAAHRGAGPSRTRSEHLLYTMQHLAFAGIDLSVGGSRNAGAAGCGNPRAAEGAVDTRPLLGNSSSDGWESGGGGGRGSDEAAPYGLPASLDVADHDFVVLLGDINSRMRENIDQARVWSVLEREGATAVAPAGSASAGGSSSAVAAAATGNMLPWDELWHQPMAPILRNLGFTEGAVTFPPTYKMTPGTAAYHRPDPTKPRKVFNHCPAWCDRILWRQRIGGSSALLCQQLEYDSAPVLMSDHLPVYALFCVGMASEAVQPSQSPTVAAEGVGGQSKQREAEQRAAVVRQKSLQFRRRRAARAGDSLCGGDCVTS